MEQSILNSTKKILGLDAAYTAFDLDIVIHINSAFSTLNDLGIGPTSGFMIEDATTQWDAFRGIDLRMNDIQTYVYLKVRMLFDPPTTSFLLDAMNKQIEELVWRINTRREAEAWTDPNL